MNINLVGSSTGVLVSISAELGTWLGVKTNASYKKPKKPAVVGSIVELSAGPLVLIDMLINSDKPVRSWNSEVNSEVSSISGISDLENMKNMIAKETSYADSNASKVDDEMDDATLRKTCTRTYVLGSKLNKISFNNLSNSNNDVLTLLASKFSDAKCLSAVKSCVLDKCDFRPAKSFMLDVKLSAVSGKTNSNKLMTIKKIFYQINGFGRALTPLKFFGIIRSSFTSELSLKKARKLAIHKKIVINVDVKQINKHLDWIIVVKEISVNLLKLAVESVFSKFRKIVSIKMQLISLWQKALVEFKSSEVADLVTVRWSVIMKKDSVHVVKAIDNKHTWSYGKKTCFIGCNPSSYVHDRCAIVCFVNEASKLAAIGSVLVFKDVNLHWTGLSLAHCAHCKQFGHISTACLLGGNSGVRGKWVKEAGANCLSTQIVGSFFSHVISSDFLGSSSSLDTKPVPMDSNSFGDSYLVDWLAFLEHSLELLTDQVSGIMKKLSFVELVPLASKSLISLLVVFTSVVSNLDSDIALDVTTVSPFPSLSIVTDPVSDLGLSSSKVLMSKVGGLESKMVALEVSVESVLEKLNCLCSGLGLNKFNGVRVFSSGLDKGFLGTGVAIIINTSLTRHVCKVSEVPGWLLLVKLLFKNKLSVSILRLYAGASLAVHFSQANDINSMIAKVVNKSSFIVLDGDFNEDGSRKSTSFRKCLDLGLVNSLGGNMAKTIDFLFISSNLANVVVGHNVFNVDEFFDTNYWAVFVDLGGLLDVQLNSLHKQKNFENAMLANAVMFSNKFAAFVKFLDLDAIWNVVCKIMVLLANEVFKKKWFKSFDDVFTKEFSRYHKLELLVSKIVKTSCEESIVNFESLMKCWVSLDSVGALAIQSIMDSGTGFDRVCFALCGARKAYHMSKLAEFCRTKEATIRAAIDKRMKSFEINKNHTIRNMLKCLFRKVVFNHLVVDNELVLKPNLVKSKIDVIMEGWTRKHQVVDNVSGNWCCQYQPLDYVFDKAFSGVMCSIEFDELFGVVSFMPDDKAAGLLGISNEFWKHCNKAVLNMLLVLLNSCLSDKSKGVLMNTQPIALIEMAYKIFSKILSDRILLTLLPEVFACSTFNVLCGDNFSVLKNISTQSPIFAIGLVIEDALEKNRKLWLVLQNMKKAYNLVGWKHLEKNLVRIKMCSKKVFFSLLWCIFYDPLLCKIKCQESVYKYKLNSHFISKNGCAESWAELSSFFAAGTFVDNTIWVGSNRNTTQHILDIASEFFQINNIFINNDKTVAILINSRVSNPSLSISGSPISIAKKGEFHWYLGIFLSTEGLSKPSLAKANSDVCFFTNLVLWKAVSNKQLLYLVLAVLHLIVSYKMQFSFVLVEVCNKWDTLIHKDLKLKSGLPLNFPSNTIYYPSFYGLKFFSQVQSESKIAFLVSFVNSDGIVDCLFSYRSHDLQVLCWHPVHPLSSSVRIHISASNNFLAGIICVLLDCGLSLSASLTTLFRFCNGQHGIAFVDQLCDHYSAVFNWYIFKCWKRLDSRGSVLEWFKLSITFFNGMGSFSVLLPFLHSVGPLNIFESSNFVSVCDHFLQAGASSLSVYMDGSLSNLGTASCRTGAATYFEDIDLGLGVCVLGLMLSTLAELQAIVLALKCVLPS
ncbi:hypothetical protein G9A89_007613, partial [Geosiphon pyriformis]